MANLNDIKLSSQDILKKQFKTKVKGFDPDDVDSYLDQVISDYETFQQIIEDLYGKIGDLQRDLLEAKEKSKASLESVRRSSDNVNYSVDDNKVNHNENSTNMEIIQRLSTLERKVYNLEKQVYGLQK